MSKEFANLVAYIEANKHGYFIKGGSSDLDVLITEVFSSSESLDLNAQKDYFNLSMSCYSLFAYTLMDRDLNVIPELLRYSLISKCFFSEGMVTTPRSVDDEVRALLEGTDEEWYGNGEVGSRIFNLREDVLQNPSLDLVILIDEFENTGDTGNISAILNNPNCPEEFLTQIINSEHPIIFEDGPQEDLMGEAEEILLKRQTKG